MLYSDIVALALSFVDRQTDPEAVAAIDGMLQLTEAKINRFLQSNKGSATTYTVITDAEQVDYALPSLFSAYRSVKISTTNTQSGTKTSLYYATPDKFDNVESGSYYTIVGDTIKIMSDQIVVGNYLEMVSYINVSPLTSTNTSNWLSDLYPDCYVQGLMAQLYAFAKDWDAAERMEAKFTATLEEIEIQDDKTTWSGSPLTMSNC